MGLGLCLRNYGVYMEHLNFLKKVHDNLLDYAPKLIVSDENLCQMFLRALHSSLIELSGCLILLLDNEGKTGVPSIARTFLETYVEFYNLHKDGSYFYNMEANYLEESKRIRDEILGKKNYLQYIDDDRITKEQSERDAESMELKELNDNGFKKLSVLERFQRAEMEDVYRSYYAILCSYDHPSLHALISRHVKIESANGDIETFLYADKPIETYLSEIQMVTKGLINSAIDIHTLLNSEALPEVKILQKSFDEYFAT